MIHNRIYKIGEKKDMSYYGVWTLLPAILVIFLAIKTKKPTESLLIGCISTYIIIAIKTNRNFVYLAQDAFFKIVTEHDNVWIIIVCGLFGSLIALLNESNSTMAIANLIGRFCDNAKSVLMAAWTMGILIFIDDYMNIMTISSCMKKICDKKKIPRATLAYVIDSTGAPACVLVPFSTWAIFYASNFYEQEAVKKLNLGGAMSSYIHAIPYMFYAILALIIVPLFVMEIVPVIGSLKREYVSLDSQIIKKSVDNNVRSGNIIDFIVPIGVMIIVTIVIDDMLLALIAAILSCFLLYVPRKIVTASRFCELWVKGIADLIPTLMILLFAFFMKQACADIRLPAYVIKLCQPYISGSFFPACAFMLVSTLAFITGDSWGVPAICVPIFIPLAATCNANILLTMGAIVSGGVFCSHACFYSDATVLTATCCEIDPMTHAKTQLPYAVIAFIISFLLYLVLGIVC